MLSSSACKGPQFCYVSLELEELRRVVNGCYVVSVIVYKQFYHLDKHKGMSSYFAFRVEVA